MKILSPARSREEVETLAGAGALEFYMGVLSPEWKSAYTNVASINRREWSLSNMKSYDELTESVKAAHSLGARVFLTMNALYTASQYPQLLRELETIEKTGVDALIVADMGLLLTLRERRWPGEIHVSTGGTTFNAHTAKFYRSLGASRVILPRQNSVSELVRLCETIDFMEREAFIFNSGCKNIDGFCTYHHGVNEIRHKGRWKWPKEKGLDHVYYLALRKLPTPVACTVSRCLNFRSDSACLLNYEVEATKGEGAEAKKAVEWLKSTFQVYSGLDPCGGCALWDLFHARVDSIKIVGRENPTWKKVRDVRYLRRMLDYLENTTFSKEEFKVLAQDEYRIHFGASCREWCYYPEK